MEDKEVAAQKQIDLLEEKRKLLLDEEPQQESLAKRAVGAVLETPQRMAGAAPVAGSVAGGMMGAGVMQAAAGGAAGRMAGQQLKAELENVPSKGLLRFADVAMPGISMMAPDLPQDIQAEISQRAMKEAPMELALGAALGVVGRGIKGLMGTRIMGKNYTLDRVTKVLRGLDKTKTAKGTALRNAIKETGDNTVDGIDDILKKLPDAAKNYLKKNAQLLGIQMDESGRIVNSLNNTQTLKESVGDFMTTKDWIEAGSKSKAAIKGVYSDIRNAMVKASPKLKPLLDDYHKYMDEIYFDVNKLVRETSGKIREKKLVSALKPGAERSKQVAVEKLSAISPEVEGAVKDISKFISRQSFKKKMVKFIPYAIAAAGGYGALRKITGAEK